MIVDSEVYFERDAHAYYDGDGTRHMSTTQAIKLAGLIDYSMVAPDVLERARIRGSLVHQSTVVLEEDGEAALGWYEIPDECLPYIEGYKTFLRETKWESDPAWIEKPIITQVAGQRVGMTADRMGTVFGLPTVLEIKCTSARHPCWGVQLASYAHGLPPPERYRNYQRLAVQLLPTGSYKLWPYEDASDFDIFCSALRIAAWKLKNRLVTLD